MERGFTLIELLVVVLIIGILTAIALPQYKKSIEQSRFSEVEAMVTQAKKIFTAYYLEHGGYPASAVYFTGNKPEVSSVELPLLTPYNRYVSYSTYFQYWVQCSNRNCGISISRLEKPGVASGDSSRGVIYHMQFYYYLENGSEKYYFYNKAGTDLGLYIREYLASQGMHFEN